jgi:phosphoribosyl-AMP cyclohydrolase
VSVEEQPKPLTIPVSVLIEVPGHVAHAPTCPDASRAFHRSAHSSSAGGSTIERRLGAPSDPWPLRRSKSFARSGSLTVGGRSASSVASAVVPTATPIEVTDEQLAAVKYDGDGLVPAIVQEEGTGEVLMMAWMNAETLRMSLAEGRTVFWSRSRQEVWRKGDTSGDRQFVRSASYDCDGDTLLFVVEQEGRGACHTGEHSCFFRSFGQ